MIESLKHHKKYNLGLEIMIKHNKL